MKRLAGRLGARRARLLARLPLFATCSTRQLRRIARWGDLIEVDADQVLVREGHSDWWFFVVVSGRVVLSHAGAPSDELLPGSHFGESALIGLRPQPMTATARESSVLFVLGPRYVLSLLSSSAGFRRALAPDVPPARFADFTHRMHAQGEEEWRALAAERVAANRAALATAGAPAAKRLGDVGAPQRDRLPGRALSLKEAAAALGALPLPANSPTGATRAGSRWWWLAPTVVAAGALLAFLLLFHPPRLVLTAGRPIDVTADITVAGARTYPTSGHYLLLWVNARQPNLAGYLVARLTSQPVVPLDSVDASERKATERDQYLASQSTAIRLAVDAAGLDPRRVTVHIHDRGLIGPSAGLAYALALDDLLTPGDLSGGRTIGVTGELDHDGQVAPIGWIAVKARGAREEHASLLVVPAAQARSVDDVMPTCGVASLRDALRALAGQRRTCAGT